MFVDEDVASVEVLPAGGPIRFDDDGSDDAFGHDSPADARVEVTRRGLVRLAIAASRVGARWERERMAGDPIDWLLAPREVFDGECAVDACVDAAPLRRCVALHAPGAGLGVDAEPEALDALLDEGVAETAAAEPGGRPRGRAAGSMRRTFAASLAGTTGAAGPRLWSCSLMRVEPGARVATFVAAVARDEREFRRRLFDRYGAMAALHPGVRVGFDQYEPIAATLVSEHLADWLSVVAAAPHRCGDDGFEVVVEHRILA